MAAEGPPAGAAPRQATPQGAARGETVRAEPTRRLFFALWPDEAMRQALAQATRKAARASGGRPVPAENLHVTLAFLGAVPERRLPRLAEIAREAAGSPQAGSPEACSTAHGVELLFDRLEHWRAAHLLCALPAEAPARVAALARALQGRLAADGFTPDLKPFRPHATVARKVMHASASGRMHPVLWRFSELALVESRTLREGALYSVVESYPLCGFAKGSQ